MPHPSSYQAGMYEAFAEADLHPDWATANPLLDWAIGLKALTPRGDFAAACSIT